MEDCIPLEDLLTAFAKEQGLSLARDTHFDANNWELAWWRGTTRYALDVQPLPSGRIEVALLRTTYPYLPKALAWARRCIPMFPVLGTTLRRPLGSLHWPCPPNRLRELLESGLPPNKSSKPTPLRGAA